MSEDSATKPCEPGHGGGRRRTGQLLWRKYGYAARITTEIDGEKVRPIIPLGTKNEPAARRKLARLLEDDAPLPTEATSPETFEQAARDIVLKQGEQGMKTWKDRLHRLKTYAFPTFGQVPVPNVRRSHVVAALHVALKAGQARRTLEKLRVDVSTVYVALMQEDDELRNPATGVKIPKGAKVDDRKRVVLNDLEFARFMACPDVNAELHTMALTSRSFGGMRTSDLHAWDWSHIDTETWADAYVPRPKTKSKDRIALPDVLVPVLKVWWKNGGENTSGPVFPSRRGKRAGQRKEGKISYAAALRDALWRAGIVRPLPGFHDAFERWQGAAKGTDGAKSAEGEARARCLIQAGSDEYLPLDFHSFRRAFNTELARAGVNVQQSMKLAGHRNPSTHMRYVDLSQDGAIEIPAAALPQLQKAVVVPNAQTPENETSVISAPPTRFERVTFALGKRCSIL